MKKIARRRLKFPAFTLAASIDAASSMPESINRWRTATRCFARILLALSLSWMLIHPAQSLHATTVRLVSLEEMVKAADRIFVGKCVSVESRSDEYGLPATYVTFLVIEQIKGDLGERVTIKQIGGRTSEVFKIPGLPTYRVGEEVLLFLHPNSQHGFTSPVGLNQGKWSVLESSAGKKMLRPAVTGRSYGQGQIKGLFDYSEVVPRLKKMVVQ